VLELSYPFYLTFVRDSQSRKSQSQGHRPTFCC